MIVEVVIIAIEVMVTMTNAAMTAGDLQRATALQRELARQDVLDRRVPVAGVERVREALRKASGLVRELSIESCGELASEARLLWLYSVMPIATPQDLAAVLTCVDSTVSFLENWSDNARPRSSSPERDRLEDAAELIESRAVLGLGQTSAEFVVDLLRELATKEQPKRASEQDAELFHEKLVEPALAAALDAQLALVELVDEIRDGAPEIIR